MSERESPDVLSSQQPTREVLGSRGGEASKQSAEDDASQERDKGVPRCFFFDV